MIDNFEKPCVLADALVPDCPVVGVSDTFAKLSTLGQRVKPLEGNQIPGVSILGSKKNVKGFTDVQFTKLLKNKKNVFQDIALQLRGYVTSMCRNISVINIPYWGAEESSMSSAKKSSPPFR